MEAIFSSELSGCLRTTQLYNPKDRRENLKSNKTILVYSVETALLYSICCWKERASLTVSDVGCYFIIMKLVDYISTHLQWEIQTYTRVDVRCVYDKSYKCNTFVVCWLEHHLFNVFIYFHVYLLPTTTSNLRKCCIYMAVLYTHIKCSINVIGCSNTVLYI
jgi:hypothetical protein